MKWDTMKAYAEILFWMTLIGAIIGAAILGVAHMATKSIENDCRVHCESEGGEMASMTIFGCSCKARESDDD